MDANFIAGLIIGGIVGAAWMAAVVAYRTWRGAIAAVPGARANMYRRVWQVVVLGAVCAVAVLAAWQ